MTTEAENFPCSIRPDSYFRKSDGMTVVVGDWPDGSVSWMLNPLPVILTNGRAVGTCSAETFARQHAKAEGSAQ